MPEGDLLIHCGDMTNRGSAPELAEVNRWFENLPHLHKAQTGCSYETQTACRFVGFEEKSSQLQNRFSPVLLCSDRTMSEHSLDGSIRYAKGNA